MLIAIALFKIQRLLRDGLRLRTACDLEIPENTSLQVQRPKEGFTVPSLGELEKELPDLIKKAGGGFAIPSATDLTFEE